METPPRPTAAVSERETEVLAALGAGLSNAQIATRLHISVRTVEGHVSSLLRKYRVADRRALAALAVSPPAGGPPGQLVGLPRWPTTFVGRAQEREQILAALAPGQLVTLVGPGGVGKTRLAVVAAGAAAPRFPFGGAFVDLVPVRAGFVAPAVAAALGVTERAQQPLAEAIVDRLARGRSLLVLDNCEHLRLLAGGRGTVVRHRSLRGVIGWSHDLLDEEEQTLFRRLAVFAGGFDLPAAIVVTAGPVAVTAGPDAGTWVGPSSDGAPAPGNGEPGPAGASEPAAVADVLGRLVDKSLVVRQREPARWRLLETIRAFAAEQLERSGERLAVERRHLRWAVATAAALLADPESGDEFDAVVDDLRAALAATPAAPDPAAHQLARSLGRLSFARRFVLESRDHYRQAAPRAAGPEAAARDLRSAAACAQVANDSGQAFELQLAAAEQAGRAGDGNARAVALAQAVEIAGRFPVTFRRPVPHSRLRQILADATSAADDPEDPIVAARLACAAAWAASPELLAPDPRLAERAVSTAQASGDPVLLSGGLDAMRTAAAADGRFREAHRITSRRLGLLPRLDPADPYAAPEIDDTLSLACSDAIAAGDLPAALAAAHRILDLELQHDHPYLVTSKVIPAFVLCGDLDRAVRYAKPMWDGWHRAGRPPAFWLQTAVHFVALGYGLRGEHEARAVWHARATQVAGFPNPFQARLSPLAAFVDARLAVHTGAVADARTLAERAHTQVRHGRYLPYARAAAAELAVVAGFPDAADRLASARSAVDGNDWATACLDRATGRLRRDPAVLATALDRWQRLGARVEWACTLALLPDRQDAGRAELARLGVPAPAAAPGR